MTHRLAASIQQARPAPHAQRAPAASGETEQLSDGMLIAFLGQRSNLSDEIEKLQARRTAITANIASTTDAAERRALEQSRADIDRRISDADVALRAINRAISGRQGTAVASTPS